MNNRKLTINNGIVEITQGVGTIQIPDVMTSDELQNWFDCPPHEDAFIPLVMQAVDDATRKNFRKMCAANGFSKCWAELAVSWSSMTSGAGWDLREHNLVYSCQVDSWWVDSVHVAKTAHRFAVCGGTVLTFTEFYHKYGSTVPDHLVEFADERHTSLKELAQLVTAPVITRRVSCVLPDGSVGHTTVTGLQGVPVDHWLMPDGITLLDAGDVVDTVTSRG